MPVMRWLRNHGFAFTERQALARLNDLGGPTRFERWSHAALWRYLLVQILGVVVAAGLVAGAFRALGWDDWFQGPSAAAIGMLLGIILSGRHGYDRWHDRIEQWQAGRSRGLEDAARPRHQPVP